MAEEVKIAVSMPGAQQVATDAKAVAAAIGEVQQASDGASTHTGGLTQAQDKAAKGSKDLAEQHSQLGKVTSSLVDSVKEFSPALGVAAEAMETLGSGASASVIGLGLVGVAIGAVTMVVGSLIQAQQVHQAHSQEYLNALADQKRAYDAIADSVQRVANAESMRHRGITAQPTEEVITAAATASKEKGLDRQGIQSVAEIIQAGGITDQAEMAALADWVSLGRHERYGSPEQQAMAFKAIRNNSQLSQRTTEDAQASRLNNPDAVIRGRSAANEVLGGFSERNKGESILKSIADQEKREGRGRTPYDIEMYLGQLLTMYADTSDDEVARKDAGDQLRTFLKAYPDAAKIKFTDKAYSDNWLNPFAPAYRRLTGLDGSGETIADYFGMPAGALPAAPTSKARAAGLQAGGVDQFGQPLSSHAGDYDRSSSNGGTTNNFINQGGTMINQGDKHSPAGRPNDARIPR